MTVSSSELLDGRDLISVKALHTEGGLSDTQKKLARAISREFEGSLLNNASFADRVVRALVIRGDCRGLCCLCPDGGGTVLARWLRTETRMSCYEQHVTNDLVKRRLQLVDELDFFLLALRKDSDFSQFFREPHPMDNRLAFFQWKISAYPAYGLFAATFHRGVCRKIDQMEGVSVKQFNNSLGSMTRVLGYIVEDYPKEKVRPSIYDYGFGELDRIVRDVVDTSPRRRTSSTGMNVLAANTRDRRYAIYITVVYGKAAARNFRECSKSTRKTQKINEKDQWRLDELSSDHPLLQPLDKYIAEQAKEEYRNIAKGRKGKKDGTDKSGLDKIRPGKAARVFLIPGDLNPDACLCTVYFSSIPGWMNLRKRITGLKAD